MLCMGGGSCSLIVHIIFSFMVDNALLVSYIILTINYLI